eukprot:scaffold46359_cov19-Prasinocladus_malaysianus.AAC.1
MFPERADLADGACFASIGLVARAKELRALEGAARLLSAHVWAKLPVSLAALAVLIPTPPPLWMHRKSG